MPFKCKEEAKKYHKQWRDANPHKQKTYSADNRAKIKSNPLKWAQQSFNVIKWAKDNKDKVVKIQRKSHLKRKFGLSENDYYEKVKTQNNCCAICKKPETAFHNRTGLVRRLSIDHDHATGKIRDLLCTNCNRAIGHLKEDLDIMQSAIEYIRRHK